MTSRRCRRMRGVGMERTMVRGPMLQLIPWCESGVEIVRPLCHIAHLVRSPSSPSLRQSMWAPVTGW